LYPTAVTNLLLRHGGKAQLNQWIEGLPEDGL